METINLIEAQALFWVIIDRAEHGQPTRLIEHGKTIAFVVPVEDGERLYEQRSRLAKLLIGC